MQLTKNGIIRINFRDYPDNVQGVKKRLLCNFNCSYCNQQHVEQYVFTEEHFKQAKEVWDSLATIDDLMLVRINFDGETMIHRWARRCCTYISRLPNVKVFEFITNNSVDPRSYLNDIVLEKTSFNCSFHPERISPDKFLRHILIIKQTGCPVFATMVVTPKLVEHFPRYHKFFQEQGICLKPLLLLGVYQPGVHWRFKKIHSRLKEIFGNGVVYPRAYSVQALDLIRKYYYSDLEFRYQYGENPQGKPCYAGVDMINVYLDGTVLRCFHGKISSVQELVTGKIKLNKEPYPCPAQDCQCPTHMIGLQEFREQFSLCDKFADHYHRHSMQDNELICGCSSDFEAR